MSKIGKIKEQIQTAIEAVKDFDEPYKTKAFEVILSRNLDELSLGKDRGEAKEGKEPKELSLALNKRIDALTKEANLTVEQLENVYDFGDQDLTVIAPLEGTVPDKQVSFTQCLLIGLERVYSKKSISAPELTKKIDDTGLNTKNLSRSLKNRPDIFRKMGKKKETVYKLTDVGKTSAIALVRTLATSVRQT